MLPLKTILHPTDFSERSEQAFRLACDLAADYDANLVLLHVVRQPPLFNDGVILSAASEADEALQDRLNSIEVPDEIGVVRKLEEGTPAVEILQLAQLCGADLIIMGTSARRGLSRLVMGSVAEEVIRRAQCPVLTVATPGPRAEARRSSEALVATAQ